MSADPEAARTAIDLEAALTEAVGKVLGSRLVFWQTQMLVDEMRCAVAAAVAEERATTGRRDAERERYIKTLVKERDAAERKVRAVETVTCWTNEDGKRFMFVDDVAVAVEIPGSRAALASPGEGE